MDYNFIKEKGIEYVEEIMLILKENNHSQMETVRLLSKNLNISLSEADSFVINSNAWSSEKEYVLNFRRQIDDFFDKLEIGEINLD